MALFFEGVSFQYRARVHGRLRQQVFDSFSWTMPPGRTVLLGPNGAGKTTLLSLAATVLEAEAGDVCLGDWSSRRDRKQFRAAIGLMPQAVRAIPGFTAREQVAYTAWLRGATSRESEPAALAALDRVGLAKEADRLVAHLSGGQQRRVALAQAVVRPARVLLLDEPTAGLDPAQRNRFRELLAEVSEDTPVLVSTHQVDDLTDLFDTVCVLRDGSIVYQGSPSDFLAMAATSTSHQAEAAYLRLVGDEA